MNELKVIENLSRYMRQAQEKKLYTDQNCMRFWGHQVFTVNG